MLTDKHNWRRLELEILNSKEESLKDWWPKPLKGGGEPHLPTPG